MRLSITTYNTDKVTDVFRNKNVEAVVISTPHHIHVPIGIQAAYKSQEKGKPVLFK